jgi:long-chain acyl-CoA synthetase
VTRATEMRFEEAVAALTAPGSRFETEQVSIGGIETTVFKKADRTLRELFARSYARGDRTFLVYEDERRSFAAVMGEVDAFADTLVRRFGVGPGDRVAIGMRNCPEWVIAFAATTSVGAIAVCLNAWWTEGELEYALRKTTPEVVVADQERLDRMAATADELGSILVGVRLDAARPGVVAWEDATPPGATMPHVEVDPDDDATILFTSGTTGLAKGAVATHRAMTQTIIGLLFRGAVDRLRQPPADTAVRAEGPRYILTVPLFHVTGCVMVMLSSFAAGLEVVMMYKWNADRALQLIERERVTHFIGVSAQTWDLLESPKFATTDTSSLTSVAGGGGPVPPQLVRRVQRALHAASPGTAYGMTETSGLGTYNSGLDYATRPTSAGRTLPIMQVEVRDASGRAVPAGVVGEIWMKGVTVIRKYWDDEEATNATVVDGWLRSGDVGRLDDEGFIYIEDRAKDVVIRGGENVYCAEVEAAVYAHPAVREVAVFGLPHERLGEEVAAVVIVSEPGSLTAESLRDFLAGRIAAYKVPSVVRIDVGPLPRNAAGKVLKRELQARMHDSVLPAG